MYRPPLVVILGFKNRIRWVIKMKQWVMLLLTLAPLATTWAQDNRQYCEEMYPVESYEVDERNQYVNECLASLGDAPATADEEGYYDGTVEDFVETLPEDTEDDGVEDSYATE